MGDDFNKHTPLIEQADMIVIATPLYWFNFPGQLKAALDKMYALEIGKRESAIKESALLVCAETGEITEFDSIIKCYQMIAHYQIWRESGIMTVQKVGAKGDILKTDALEKAEQMGLHA